MITLANPNASPSRERTRTVALWLVQVVLAGQFALAGVGRLAVGYEDLAGRFNRIAGELWLRSTDGSLEPGGAIGTVVPGLLAVAALALAAFVVIASVIHLAGLLAWAHWPARR